MKHHPRPTVLVVTGIVMAILGIALAAGGAWLIALGGSWYYLLAGIALAAAGILLWRAHPAALWLYAALVLATLLWSLWEVGLDWWPLAARGDVLFLLGLFLITPWITRALARAVHPGAPEPPRRPPAVRTPMLSLAAVLALFLAVAVASWFVDLHRIDGSLPPARAAAATPAEGDVPDGEWHAYGRTGYGQRYSPLAQITPENVANLQVAWRYQTGDLRGRPGDPEETTFQVTPLKIGNRLFLCTPHQSVIALNATTGEVIWRYDPQIQGQLALQHLTCRGLSYHAGSARTAPARVPAVAGDTPPPVNQTTAVPGDAQAAATIEAPGTSEAPPAGQTSAADGAAPAPAEPPAQQAPAATPGDAAPASSAERAEVDGGGDSDPGSTPVTADHGNGDGALTTSNAPPGVGTATDPQAGLRRGNPDLPLALDNALGAGECDARLFMPTADGRLIALDPEDGSVCTDFGGGTGQIDLWANMPHLNPGSYYSTSPVVVTQDLVIVGGTVLDNVSTTEPSGVIRAFDVRTGELVWNWDSGNPEATEPIAEGETYTPNSPNSWSISAVDEAIGLVYIPMGNEPPDQWGADRTEDSDRYSSSVVALEIDTGRVRWHFQTVRHDLWDYDVPSQPTLIDLTVGGQTVPALVQPTKQGELYVLDRRTGEPVLPVTDKPAPQGAVEPDYTAPSQPVSKLSFDPPELTGADMWGATMFDQLACRIAFHRLRYEGRYTPPSLEGTLVYPGNFGVFNWGGIAVDPQRQVAFTTPAYLAFVSRLIPREDDETLYVSGANRPEDSLPALNENFGAPYAVELYAFTSALGLPCQAPPWGYVAGADLTTGDVVWMRKNGTVRDASPLPLPFAMGVPSLGGPMITGGGVAFLTGTIDYYIRAYDLTTGRELWRDRLPAGGQATPMSYTGEDGRQYVLAIAGGHGSLGTKAGDSVIAYALPAQ